MSLSFPVLARGVTVAGLQRPVLSQRGVWWDHCPVHLGQLPLDEGEDEDPLSDDSDDSDD